MIGNYYSYDNPAALKTQIDDYMGDPDDFETLFSLLYTVYSVPNVFLPFLGGYFVDKFGVRICMIVFTSFIACGQVVFAFGLSIKSWPVMLVGRVIFGFGGESLSVANSAILADWFEGKELAFAFGLNLSIARLGSVINNLVSPALANGVDLQFALWFSAILCGASVGCALILAPIDKAMELKLSKAHPKLILGTDDKRDTDINNPLLADDLSTHDLDSHRGESGSGRVTEGSEKKDEDDSEAVKFNEVFKFSLAFWLLVASCLVVYGCVLPFNNIASSLLLERDYFIEPPDGCHLQDIYACENDDASSSLYNPPVGCPSSTNYQPPLPYNATIGGKTYNPLTTDDIDCTSDDWSSSGSCTYEYCKRQDDATVTATTVMSIPYIISACLSPVLGKVVDHIGKRAIVATFAPLLLIFVHLSLGISTVTPEVPLAGQGMAYSGFAAVLWPSIPLVVEKRLIGLAYGVTTSIQNMGLASFPLIVASIYTDNGDKYIPNVEYFFVSLATLGTLIGFYLNYYDYNHGSIFNRASAPEAEADPYSAVGEDGEEEREAYRKYSKGSFSAAEEIYKGTVNKSGGN